MYEEIKAFIANNREGFKSPIYEDIFVCLCVEIFEIIDDDVAILHKSNYGIVKDVYDKVFCLIFRPMAELNNNLSDALAEQVKYGTKIAVTAEQLEELIKEIKK